MIKVDIFVNGKFWRAAEISGIEEHFQVKIIEPDGSRSPFDVYVELEEKGDSVFEEDRYFAFILDPELEPDPENEYCLRRK